MRSERDIERSFRRADLDVAIGAERDSRVLNKLLEVHRQAVSSRAKSVSGSYRWALAAAAVMALAAGTVLLVGRSGPPEPEPAPPEQRTTSTIELATAISLEKAFRQGGIEAVEKQYKKAFGASRTRQEAPSIEELLAQLKAQDL